MSRWARTAAVFLVCAAGWLAACGGGGGAADSSTTTAPDDLAPTSTASGPASALVEMEHRAWSFEIANDADPEGANCSVTADESGTAAFTWGRVISRDGSVELEVEYTRWPSDPPHSSGHLRIAALDGSFEYVADAEVGTEPVATVAGAGAVFDAVVVRPEDPEGARFAVTVRLVCPSP